MTPVVHWMSSRPDDWAAFFKRPRMNLSGYDFLFPGGESFEKARQFLIDSPPSSNKDCLRRFIRKYGDKIDSETTAMVLAVLFEGISRHSKKTTARSGKSGKDVSQ
jgi:hypothetical protein